MPPSPRPRLRWPARSSAAAARRGFSLAETLVVLGVTSVLLLLLFSVAGRGVATGFRLADRSLTAADAQVGAEAVRVLLRGVRLPEAGRGTPFVGDADALTAAVTPLRTTACTGAAPAPAVRLSLDGRGGRTRLVCQGPGGRNAVLLDLGRRPAAFAYALAGRPWTDQLTVQRPPPPAVGAPPPAALASPRLWVRLATADGAFDLIEALDPAPASSATTP